MNKIEKLLADGDLRSAGNSEKVVAMVLREPALFADAVNAILVESPAAKMRACDAVEKITRVHPEWLSPYKKLLLSKISRIDQKEVRWHLAQILPRLKLTSKERETVYHLMLGYLDDKSRIVTTFAMQALADLAGQDSRYRSSVKKIVTQAIESGPPSMQSRGRKLLASLDTS